MQAQHLIIDAEGLNPNPFYVDDERRMFDFLNTCVRLLKMEILRGPCVDRDTAANPGLTGFVTITTSHLAIHVFDHGHQVRMDCYSCVPFSTDIILGLFDTYYPSKSICHQVIERLPVQFPSGE